MPALRLAPHELSDFRLLAWGAYDPLSGLMREEDYRSVVASMRLASGRLWSLPIAIGVGEPQAKDLARAQAVDLADAGGNVVGAVLNPEVYRVDPLEEAKKIYGTADPEHPGAARVLSGGAWRVGGDIEVRDPAALELRSPFDGYAYTPAAVRAAINERGWQTVVAFQTRNPIHRAHEYLTKTALEGVDGLLVHPLVGETKSDDIPAEVRLRCYEVLLERYYPKSRTLLALFPAHMRYAGPREAVFHAQVRANYGATHFIVGRDHAGVGSYYGSFAAQDLLRSLDPSELGIIPLFFDNAFYCTACDQMATEKTCPHDASHRFQLSGSRLRQLLTEGKRPPPEYSRPEVADILVASMRHPETVEPLR